MNKLVQGNRSDKNHSTLKDRIASLVIVIECVVLIFSSVELIRNSTSIHMRVNDAKQLLSTVERQEYALLADYVAANRAMGVDSAEYTDVYAVADYYCDGLRYKGCLASGDMTRADEYHESMLRDIEHMGELRYVVEKIDSVLMIE